MTKPPTKCPGCYTADGGKKHCYRYWWLTTCPCVRCVNRRDAEAEGASK
ncbi:MAG TPA: hypothetical protein VNM48_02345 [Chloroflexota bacterium]|nr:hypothetical protein [Chloroflexota bacterium]